VVVKGPKSAHLRHGPHQEGNRLVQAVRCALSPPVTAKEVPLTIRAAAAEGVATSKPGSLVQAVRDAMWQPTCHGGAV
jgi:hypothetical protein